MKTIIAVALLLASAGVNAQVTSNTASSAQTASTAAAQNAGNRQDITFKSSNERDTSVKTNPGVVLPNLYGSFSQASCMVSAGGGFSGGLIGVSLGGPVEDESCTQRLNSTLLMQMANNARPVNADMADRLVRAATNGMCQINDRMYAVLSDQGLCDSVDFDGYKEQRRTGVPQQDRLPVIARNNALGFYPSTGN